MVQHLPPRLSYDFEWLVEPEDVLAACSNEVGSEWETLILWKGQLDREAIWDFVPHMQRQFLHFHLRTRCLLKEGVLLNSLL